MDKWSMAFLVVAPALWLCLAVLMPSSYGPESYAGEPRCEGPLMAPFQRPGHGCDSELRQWPAPLGVLGPATLASVVAAATTVHARLLGRLSRLTAGGDARS
ncbi:hypothetical protein [Streptomyces sp. SID8352]|uniref:hypothetical protein n=1 Tax=Streptomyces sp. SID8352 TaxID=2690338 RepID=UPI00136E4EB5|nr:hypothetical protein [Streptomyces sp. SID8352]MYU23331.1 hypothetical protein [Streptomyces sp. SID8352]